LGGVFAKNTSRETNNFHSALEISSLDWYFSQIPLPNMIYLYKIHDRSFSWLGTRTTIKCMAHGVGSNQFISVNIGVFRLLSVITTTPFGNYGTSETMFDQKRWKKTKIIGKILPILSLTEQ
jgi:hypothetical protein